MKCPRCSAELKIVLEEPMGEVEICVSCGTEVTLHFDKHPDQLDGIHKAHES
jgi:hypothetical protein